MTTLCAPTLGGKAIRMDIGTILGLVLGMILLLVAIMLGGSLIVFVDIPSVFIVIGGSITASMTAFPLANLLKLPKVMTKSIFAPKVDCGAMIREMVKYAEVARRDGILALEGMTDEMEDELLILGVKMAVDGTDPDLIEQVLDADVENMLIRHAEGKAILDAVGRYAPAFGMIGTLIGLVAMLANMSDPSSIGGGMAVALLTTLYGAVLSNCVFLPLADKLSVYNDRELLAKTIVVKGVMAIQSGDNPRVVEQKLKTFLSPGQRVVFDNEALKAAA